MTYHVSPIFCSTPLLDRELHAFKIAFFAFSELLSILEIKVARRSGKRTGTTFGRAVTVKNDAGRETPLLVTNIPLLFCQIDYD